MAVEKAEPDPKPRFNYLVCLDIVVLACILVIAGRPDGLAITITAIIVAIAAALYRYSMGVKSYVTNKSRATKASPANAERAPARHVPAVPAERIPHHRENSKSWLRESD